MSRTIQYKKNLNFAKDPTKTTERKVQSALHKIRSKLAISEYERYIQVAPPQENFMEQPKSTNSLRVKLLSPLGTSEYNFQEVASY